MNFNGLAKRYYAQSGYVFGMAEHYNAFSGKKRDLFTFIDAVAFNAEETVAVQVTSHSNHSARLKKIRSLDVADFWLKSESRKIHLITFGKNSRGNVTGRLTFISAGEIKTIDIEVPA
jgi:hypothetical protein